MTATEKNSVLSQRIARSLGIHVALADCNTLRRAELTLSRWAERECGDGSNWYIQRDEQTGVPYEHYCGDSTSYNPKPRRIPDKEAGALRRAEAIASHYNLQVFHQGDPRGCLLYIGGSDMTDSNYPTTGVACHV